MPRGARCGARCARAFPLTPAIPTLCLPTKVRAHVLNSAVMVLLCTACVAAYGCPLVCACPFRVWCLRLQWSHGIRKGVPKPNPPALLRNTRQTIEIAESQQREIPSTAMQTEVSVSQWIPMGQTGTMKFYPVGAHDQPPSMPTPAIPLRYPQPILPLPSVLLVVSFPICLVARYTLGHVVAKRLHEAVLGRHRRPFPPTLNPQRMLQPKAHPSCVFPDPSDG